MKVCIVTSYPPNRARLSEYSKYLVEKLAESSKIDLIYVIADVAGGGKNRAWEGPKVQVIRTWRHDNPLSLLTLIPRIIKLKPNIVHFNLHFQSFGRRRIANFTGLSLPFLLKLFGVKTIVTIHNLGEKVDLKQVEIKPTLLNRIGIAIATRIILSADRIIVTVGSYVKHLMSKYRCKKVLYIRHGTSLKRNNYPPIDPPEKRILLFGHMAPHKGLPVMFEAFKQLLKEMNNIRLIIAGTDHPNFPGYLNQFKNAKIKNVQFLGYIEDERLEELFSTSDIVVLPYLTATGTSGVFHIACGFGKPIVASDLPEIRELVEEGASALLVPPGNPSALKEAIKHLLRDPEKCLEMSQRNLAYASKETWEEIAKRYEEVYLKLNGE